MVSVRDTIDGDKEKRRHMYIDTDTDTDTDMYSRVSLSPVRVFSGGLNDEFPPSGAYCGRNRGSCVCVCVCVEVSARRRDWYAHIRKERDMCIYI